MKIHLCFLPYFIIFLMLFSCSNDGVVQNDGSDLETVRSVVSRIGDSSVWSLELEKDRLGQNLSSDSSIHDLTRENAKVFPNYRPAVYPAFRDFGSLDISALEKRFYSSAQDFCERLCRGDEEGAYSMFLLQYKFSFVFFLRELKAGWQEHFFEDYPVQLEKSEAEKEAGRAEEKPDAAEKELEAEAGDEGYEAEGARIFDRWIFGEPFINEELVQLPVRFYCDAGFVDAALYMSAGQENSFYDIRIERWEKHD